MTQISTTKPVLYTVTDSTIAAMATEFAALKIQDVTDTSGYAVVHKARMSCVKARAEIEKTRKQLKADSLEYGRRVDAEAKRLIESVLSIEARLEAEQDRIDRERERIKTESEERILAARRCVWASAEGSPLTRDAMLAWTDEQFERAVDQAREAQKARRIEAERIEAERIERERQAEAARIERERAAIEAERQNREESERLAAERKKIEAEREVERKAIEAERAAAARREAEERAKAKAEFEAERKAIEAERQAIARREAEAEAERQRILIEESRARATALIDRLAPSLAHIDAGGGIDATRQMLADLYRLANSDGCVAAAWALRVCEWVHRGGSHSETR